jgi:hypothetical protein
MSSYGYDDDPNIDAAIADVHMAIKAAVDADPGDPGDFTSALDRLDMALEKLKAERRPSGVSVTLSRAEAVSVESLLVWTTGDFSVNLNASTSAGTDAAIRRLQLERAVRAGGEWWEKDGPGYRDTFEKLGRDGYEAYAKATCPNVFTLPPDAAAALAELLPIAFGDTLDDGVEEVVAVAARLGVELSRSPSDRS